MSERRDFDRAAVLHIPMSQYAFAVSEKRLVIRLRARKGDLSECVLYYGDRADRMTPMRFRAAAMRICAQDADTVYYEAEVEESSGRICYYFKLIRGDVWSYYYADRFAEKLPVLDLGGTIVDNRSQYYQYPFILREEIPDIPAWFRDAVVYNIFPDSFADGRRRILSRGGESRAGDGTICRSRLGGTIGGIYENLDYLQGLGVTCLYLNPVFTAGEYHKYDVTDYYHIDPGLGTDEDFGRLVEAVHERGMRILIDGVFNHCSWNFFAFRDVVEKGERSHYRKWFYELEFPVIRPEDEETRPNYTCFAYERKMPKLNTSEEEVQAYFAEVGAYWVREYHVDGWRLDVANEIDRGFWRRFRKAVRRVSPEAVLIGEVWENAESWLKGDMFDSTMNYEFRRICAEYLTAEAPDALNAAYQFERMRMRYPDVMNRGQLNLLDSHDVPRFLSLCGGDLRLWKLGCILLFLMPGVPSLLYGDERELCGIREEEYRRAMDWEGGSETEDFVKRLIRIRRDFLCPEMDYAPLWELTGDGLFAFVRSGGGKRVAVLVNAGREEKAMPEGAKLREEDACRKGNACPERLVCREVLLASCSDSGQIPPFGYLVYREDADASD